MKKRFLSWLLVLTMVISLIPSTLVTALAADLPSAQASGQAGKTKVETTLWPSDLNADITDFRVTGTIIPGDTLTVKKGKTLIVHGNGTLSGTGRAQQTPFFIVEDGGHLVLNNVTVTLNKSDSGTVVVQKGGLLDLGYNDQKDRFAPSITGNTTASGAAKNLVIADGATVRLNAAADKAIGVSCTTDVLNTTPKSLIQGGRYALTNQDIASGKITTDDSRFALALAYDQLFIRSAKPRMLFWDQTSYFDWHTFKTENRVVDASLNDLQVPAFREAGAEVVSYAGSRGNPKRIDASTNILGYDIIFLCTPDTSLIQAERALLLDYLNNGGRIVLQGEDASVHTNFGDMNTNASSIAQSLGGGFTIMASPAIEWLASMAYKETHKLTEGINVPSTNWKVGAASPIKVLYPDEASTLFWGYANNNSAQPFVVDQRAGNKNGAKWGNVTVMSDANMWGASGAGTAGTYSRTFAQNLLNDSRSNRLSAAAGYNPNDTFSAWEATTTTTTTTPTPYRTPYAALQKAVEGNTVTLLTNSRAADGGLTPTRDELLFEKSTLAYETGSQYDGSKIYADKAGVYLDITKTGEVNLRSGTVTVTPKDATYPLVLNGAMDTDGNAITGGYKITSATKYQLIADDPTSPIFAENGGKASIVIPNAGESVTVDYGGGKIVTYTAKTANDKIYLGWYQVKKQTPANMTWTDADKAWHGHTFTTTLEPNVGYEINGENLTIADTDNAMTGGYTLKKQGDAATDPNDQAISWTTYSTDDGKVTVKQQHLHSGGSDRNGIAILTVKDVHADISIGAGNNTVNAKAPTIYVVGIGKRTGHADVQLWEYTTVRNTKDGILDKPVSGWPWEKWKVSSAASGNGTESDYKQNKVTLTSDATKLDTSSETAQYTINLETGDKVVVFYYDWNMTEVTIKATDAKGNPIPDYTDQVVEYESNKQTTITAPNLIGYQPVGGQNTQDFTPSETNKEITFQYEKTTGNLIYKAVYVDGAGIKRELGTFSGGTLVQGQAPNKSAQYAPRFDNYELADKNADGVASAESYTGTDITVTYTYKAKVKTIPVEAYVDSPNGVRLLNDTTTYKDITTGQTITVTAPDIAGYKVKGAASQTVFVTNDTDDRQKVVFLYEKDDDNNAYVLVKLVDSSNGDKLISSYQVPGVKDKAQLIKAPAAPYGYKADPVHPNEDKTVTPTGTQAPYKAEVVFKYVPNVHTVTIELKDVSETPAKPLTVNNYVTSYRVVDSEGLTITAPSIYGYTMAENSESVKVLSNITKDETVTFEYEPIDKQMVYIHVKGVGPGSNTLFESRESVTHGTASKEVNVFTLPGLKLASATVGGTDKTNDVANGKLTVNLTSVTKGGTVEVLLTYESNMANVTVKAMYNGQPLQSYTTSLEKDVQATINAPSVAGYTADAPSKTVTPGDDSTANTVTFNYTKDKGNVTVVVVDTDGSKELYRKDGGTVNRGDTIDLTGDAKAPTIEYFTTPSAPKSVTVNGTEVNDLTNYTYDGVGDIIVTYEYTRKTQDVIIVKKNVATGAEINRQTLQNLPVGKSHTFADGSVTIPSSYQAVTDRNPTSYFVEDKANQTVTFWYKNTRADQYTQITVNLICDNKVFQSYPVTAIKGQPTTILAPTWTGYELKKGTQASATVTPNGTPDNDKVEFQYTIDNPKTVTVVLKDNSNSTNPNLNAPANYISNYKLKMGDNVTIWAPAIDGYSLVSATLGTNTPDSSNKQMVQVSYDALANGKTTVTFAYMPVSQADFVKHTVNFVLTLPGGTEQPLYTHEKLIPKGTGNQVVYKEDDVKYTVPGYAYQGISYEVGGHSAAATDVKDNVNATITYRFTEASAWIKINQECVGGSAAANPDHNATQTLTGYREGQENVVIIAPVLKDHALKSDQPMSYTFSKLTTGENEHTFQYVKAGDTRFVLKEIGTDKIIAVLNAETGKNYSDPTATDSPLNLSAIGYTYTPDSNASGPFQPGSTDTVDTTHPGEYTVYYKKMTRKVKFVAVDKTKLDDQNKKLDDVIKNDTVSNYTISGLNPVTPEDARVGESYKAVAQSFDSWALKDDYSKYYEVPVGTDPLKVYFMYVPKTTGTVTVHYHFGTAAEKGEKLNEYTITAVAGENLKISAPEYLLNNKYHLRTSNTNPYHLTVTQSPETVDFYYEANFVTVTTKVNLDGTDTGTHETYEVIKDTTSGSGSTTLYPPEKAGYTLVGITADGATLPSGGAEQLPTEYADNKLNLAGLTKDATVTYYYKTTKASEYQTKLTVEYKYNGYDLATDKKINANTGEANSIDIPAFDGYTASTYNFTDGSTVKVNGSGVNGTTVSVTPAEKTATLTITYTRPDGSIVLPGKGDKIGDGDDIIVKPTDSNTPPTLNPGPNPAKGSVTIPKDPAGNTGTVTRPKDPTKPADGKEDIIVPGGTTIDKDGTIHLPDGGGDIKPDQKIPDALPDTYVAITYDSNNGSGDVKKEIGKKGELKVAGSLFTHSTSAKFEGWNDSGLGSGTAYAKDKTVDTSITLYAKWSANYKYRATITYKPNDGITGKDVFQNVGHDTDPKLKATLQSNTFQISGWLFGGWNEEADGSGELRQPNDTWELADQDAKILYAQWYKVNADGSITVPGKDGNPNNKDTNATANGNGNVKPKLVPTRNDKGEIKVPKGGSVTLPDGSVIGMPDGGKLLPNGTVIINRPEDKGTITIPGTDGTNPDVTDKNNQPEADATIIELVYQINDGKSHDEVTVKVVKGDTVSILDCPFTWAGHQFVNWMGTDNKEYASGANYTAGDNDLELHAQWVKVNDDGSIELPGTDGKLEAPGNEDNVIVTPDKPGGKVTPQPDGSVKVEDKDGTVTRPTNPDHPENGKEEIKVPEGTVVEPDGTIKLPDNTTINPDQRIPDDVTPADYYVVTYEPGDGSGDVIRQIIAKDTDTTLLGADTFTAPNGKTFDGWLDEDQNAHDAGDPLTVDKSMTFTAKWKDGTPTPPAQDYSAEIVFDPNTGDATATQTISSDSETITRNLDPYTQHFTVPTDWTFMGWSTTKAASQSSTFYEDGEKVTLKNGKTLNLYAIVYKVDADTGVITLPGKGGQPNDGDDVTVTPGAGSALTPDKGFIKAPAGSEIKQPGNENPIKVIEGEVNVYPDGSVFVPEGSKVQLPDGTEVDGEATIDPDGNPDTDNTKPIQRPDGTIVLPGENGKTGDPDDITIAPAGPNQPAGRIDEDGNVTITDPDGADVNLPGNTPEDIKVPNGTLIKPNGDMTLLYTIRYVDGSGTEIKTATVKSVQRGIPDTVAAPAINGYTLSGAATQTASGEVSANLADYTITFTYTKNSSGGGSSGGGGGSSSGGGSVSSSFVIKASAGNGGIISPSGNVTVSRGKDQSFSINPVNGYRISDVIVDGKSVGAVSTYTFDSVKANHTIEVKFTKLNSIVADPEVTGVAGWLQTKEHNGYMGGYGNGLFGPNDNMTRAQAAQMFYNLLLNKDVDITVNFTDVPADAWYGNAVRTLASLGVIKGIGNGQFAPNRTITRAEFTVIAMRFANVSADVTNPFTDIATNDWYYTAVTSAVSYGWINGYSDGSFRPQATITRAEVVTIVNRMLNRTADRNFVDSNVTAQFDDVPNTYWAYYNIMEATIAHDHSIDNDGVESWGKQK